MISNELISYRLSEDEVKQFVSADYGVDSKSGNKTIGKTIVEVMSSFEIKKERSCFYSQRVKDLTIQKLKQNRKAGPSIKMGIASNYVHYMIMYQIRTFIFYKNNPDIAKIVKGK
jgi:hypothetical protein